MKTAEDDARAMLQRMGVPNAARFSSGDIIELANLIAAARGVLATIDKAEWVEDLDPDKLAAELRAALPL